MGLKNRNRFIFLYGAKEKRPGINHIMPHQTEAARTARADQLQYYLPKATIQRELELRGLKRVTEIWIYPIYPDGYTAVVGVPEDRVLIFSVDYGVGILLEEKKLLGFRPNGSLIY